MVSQITVPLGDIYHRNPPISSHRYYFTLLSKQIRIVNHNCKDNLAQPRPGLLVKRKGLEGSALGVHLLLEIQLAAASVDVDRVELDPRAPVAHDELVAEVEEEHDRRGKVALEEGFGAGSCSDGLEILLARLSLM